MDKVKKIVSDAIKKKIEEEIEKLNDMLKKNEDSNNIAQSLTIITDTFGNSQTQSDLIKDLVKNAFNSNFIKESKIESKMNEIVISNGVYSVVIPKSFLKTIKVQRNLELKETKKPLLNLNVPREFYELYLKNSLDRSAESERMLLKLYLEQIKGVKYKLFGNPKFEDLKEEIGRTYNEMMDKIYSYNSELDKWKENCNLLTSSETDDFKFLKDIQGDLESFLDPNSGWKVSYKNLNTTALKLASL